MRFACLLVACWPVLGQAPPASPITKAPGDTVTLDISANSQPSRVPVALKWEVVFPAQVLELDASTNETGAVVKDSGKSLECKARTSYAYVCTLSGGQKPVPDGLIASFHFKVKSTAQAGKITIKVQKNEATTVDAKQVPLDDTETVVIIR